MRVRFGGKGSDYQSFRQIHVKNLGGKKKPFQHDSLNQNFWGFLSGVKRWKREVDYCSPSSAVDKPNGAIPPLPFICLHNVDRDRSVSMLCFHCFLYCMKDNKIQTLETSNLCTSKLRILAMFISDLTYE